MIFQSLTSWSANFAALAKKMAQQHRARQSPRIRKDRQGSGLRTVVENIQDLSLLLLLRLLKTLALLLYLFRKSRPPLLFLSISGLLIPFLSYGSLYSSKGLLKLFFLTHQLVRAEGRRLTPDLFSIELGSLSRYFCGSGLRL